MEPIKVDLGTLKWGLAVISGGSYARKPIHKRKAKRPTVQRRLGAMAGSYSDARRASYNPIFRLYFLRVLFSYEQIQRYIHVVSVVTAEL